MPTTVKISGLPAESAPSTSDLVPIVKAATMTTEQTPLSNILALIATSTNGWNNLPYTPNTVTYNGNRSYTLVFNGVDLRTILSPGYRMRSTRTVAAPTQCTSLNGTTQYYSKTSPAGMAFTNNFVGGGWVKLSSYSATRMTIASRYNGTSGWEFGLFDGTGQVFMQGFNAGSGNRSYVLSNQSIPLNKWVHVSAQLDMATFTATTTTSYTMIDGVDVPASVGRGGTLPTALIQAGNLEIGSQNGGLNPFPGKIAQAFVTSAKVTQAIIQSNYYAQAISPTETSLISAYSFNNTLNDLNTTNANNLTANGSAVATNVDAPWTQQAGGVPNGTLDNMIVQSVTFSTNTTVAVQVAEGCTIPTSGGVSAVAYSSNKAPYGFPVQRTKWRIDAIYANNNFIASPTLNTWYNQGQIYGVVGEWRAGYDGALYASGGSSNLVPTATLSTANNTASDSRFTVEVGVASSTQVIGQVKKENDISVISAAPLYLNIRYVAGSASSIGFVSSDAPTTITLENAYL